MNEFKNIIDDYDPADKWVLNGDRPIERENDKIYRRQPDKINDSNFDSWKTQNKEWR
jgi:hypothetical protein